MTTAAGLVKVVVLFEEPVERPAFERHLADEHLPLVRTIPSLTNIVTNRFAGSLTGGAPFYLMLELHFCSEEAMQEGLNSEAGQAMAADLSRFASGGVSVLLTRSSEEARGD